MDSEQPVHSNSKIQVGGVNVHIVPRNGTAVELGINQKQGERGKMQDAAYAVIARAVTERFGDRVVAKQGGGWMEPHEIRINFTAQDKKTGKDLPPITADDVKTMLNELSQEYPTGPDIERAARELGGVKGRA